MNIDGKQYKTKDLFILFIFFNYASIGSFIFLLPHNVFAYEQWRSSGRSPVQVHKQLCEAQTYAPPKARHCIYAVLCGVFHLIIKYLIILAL